ncbi:hypothetical protein B0H13DRAFT_2662916 [Mycena leptocephala]|nr:hypothetical protein B0H13DRAFT_2662916 [Mycena leptocephala]
MLAYISGHGDSILSTRVLDSDLESCRRICSLLRHQSAVVRKEAIHTLSCISAGSQEGAEAVLDALQSFSVRLQSPNFGVVRWTCWVLSEIVEYPSLTAALLRIDPCKQLFWLLRHPASDVRSDADYALRSIETSSEEAAQFVAKARALEEIGANPQHLRKYPFLTELR